MLCTLRRGYSTAAIAERLEITPHYRAPAHLRPCGQAWPGRPIRAHDADVNATTGCRNDRRLFHKGGSVRGGLHDLGMPQNFIESRGEQGFLLPPDVRDWVAPDHLAWFVIDAVGSLDLGAFYAAYRADGHGRAAYEPSMMLTLILYGFATGVRSSRAIERHCREHVAYRVITGNLVPDHVTVARFVCRHELALAALFSQVLGLCAEAGLVESGVVSVDGTRIRANASRERNQEFGQIAMEIVERVKATDEAEDEEFGEARGDELPEQLRTPEGRREFFRRARQKLKSDAGGQELGEGAESDAEPERGYEFDAERIVARVQGREGWRREAHRQLERQRWEGRAPVPSSRQERLLLAAERLEDDLGAERAGNEAYQAWRAAGIAADGSRRMAAGTTKPYQPPEVPAGKVNITDPDSKVDPRRAVLCAGLQRTGGGQRAADRAGGRDHQQLNRLLPTGPDGHRHARRARAGWRRAAA